MITCRDDTKQNRFKRANNSCELPGYWAGYHTISNVKYKIDDTNIRLKCNKLL